MITCSRLQPYTLHIQASFRDLPTVLLFRLMNFTRPWSGHVCCHFFKFPDRLSMAPYMTTKPGQMDMFVYDLYTVVVYEKGFHSIVYVREFGQWYQHSKDGKIGVEALFVHTQKANLLGYTRAARASAPTNCSQVGAERNLLAWACPGGMLNCQGCSLQGSAVLLSSMSLRSTVLKLVKNSQSYSFILIKKD